MKEKADFVICAITPEPFYAVGRWYQDFSQTADEEVGIRLARQGTRENTLAAALRTDVVGATCINDFRRRM